MPKFMMIYKGEADASKVTSSWHGWLHHTYDEPPSRKPLPTKSWEKPHSPSYSGPVVSGDTVFTTETIVKKTERVTAYKFASGEVVWTAEWEGAMAVPFFAASNGDWIRSTPAWQD